MPSSLIVPGGRPEPQPVVPDPTGPVACTTAFLVYQKPDSTWHASHIDVEVVSDREVTFDDVTAGCANILDDIYLVETEPDPVRVTTAFVVFQLPEGLWQLANEINVPLVPERPPTYQDLRGGLAVTMRDVHSREIAQQSAQATIHAQMQVGQAIAEQRQNAQVQQQLEAARDKQRRAGRG